MPKREAVKRADYERASVCKFCKKLVDRVLVGGQVPALRDLAIVKFPQDAPVVIQIVAVVSIGPNMLTLHNIIVIDAYDQLFGFDIRLPHEASHCVEKGHHFVNANFGTA
jgi:hypothetical protein